jgi:DnaJ-class molecular chaperone
LLSDDEKRRMYDQFGHAGVDPNASTGPDFDGFSFGGPFNFGGFTAGNFSARGGLSAEDVMEAFEEMLGGRRDVQTAVTLSFLEAVNGTSKTVKVEYSVRDRSGRRQRKQKSVKVVIPPGVDDGMILVLAGQGAESANGSAGDLQVQVKVQKDPYFRRERNDVFVDVSISVAQAILGTTIEVLTLDGMVNLKVNLRTALRIVHGRILAHLSRLSADTPVNVTGREVDAEGARRKRSSVRNQRKSVCADQP